MGGGGWGPLMVYQQHSRLCSSLALFCRPRQLISFPFNRLRTLCQNTGCVSRTFLRDTRGVPPMQFALLGTILPYLCELGDSVAIGLFTVPPRDSDLRRTRGTTHPHIPRRESSLDLRPRVRQWNTPSRCDDRRAARFRRRAIFRRSGRRLSIRQDALPPSRPSSANSQPAPRCGRFLLRAIRRRREFQFPLPCTGQARRASAVHQSRAESYRRKLRRLSTRRLSRRGRRSLRHACFARPESECSRPFARTRPESQFASDSIRHFESGCSTPEKAKLRR